MLSVELMTMNCMGWSRRVSREVTRSEWVNPVVIVPKADGHVRLCGDLKVTINPLLNVDQHPL